MKGLNWLKSNKMFVALKELHVMTKKIRVAWCIDTLVDDIDYEYLIQWKWSLSSKGYAVRGKRINGESKLIIMHRVILERKLGHDDFEQVHHRNWNKIDNRRDNLQAVTNAQNQWSRGKQKIIHQAIRAFFKQEINGVLQYKCTKKQRILATFMVKLWLQENMINMQKCGTVNSQY